MEEEKEFIEVATVILALRPPPFLLLLHLLRPAGVTVSTLLLLGRGSLLYTKLEEEGEEE